MQRTPGSSSLRYAPREVSMVQKLCESMDLCTVEAKRQPQEVLKELKDCDIFHFAGHGETDETNPLESQLRLEDWTDTVLGSVRSVKSQAAGQSTIPGLCGTSQIKDKRLIDESLLAGFKHVAGTLREAGDEPCINVAETVYQELKDSGMDNGSVCRGLHNAVWKLRDNWVTDARMRAVKKSAASVKDGESDSKDGLSGGRSARDIVPLDEEENERPAPRVAYVHHGSI
ncbi:hypothetical protein FVEG_14587 [Fusarium verticillioides 7600]|uniref:Uncharacterized protein n=1 Tax=Gibberella moniliformis (strain M3125 / FGSC 7600) TaxID=334819 RepID=W7LTN5_GIBM7|nr:hypothetical protein FVEG_14587 [Fusarium verticillioides 7600]EWG35927.1 hypothetical protein FVEG_14587 [Fusarium verticillioides 7600]